MAVKSEIWIRAHLRRCFNAGLTGAIVRRGASEAGAIIVCVHHGEGRSSLYGAPPGPAYDEQGERLWVDLRQGAVFQPGEVNAYIAKQVAYDPDLWVIEIDDRHGVGLLNVVP